MSAAKPSDTADFLRRLSVADAKVLLERTRKEKENKTKEMQKMIGVRYRDLIESADKIVNMHSAALRLEGSLKEMPEKWKHIEATFASTLAQASRVKNDLRDQVVFLVTVSEKMWQLLDRGESFRALQLYLKAKEVYSLPEFQRYQGNFPFVPSEWSCIESFRPRIVACAQTYLTCRGKESSFYAQNLCTLAVLAEPSITVENLFKTFLGSRSKWMSSGDESRKKEKAQVFVEQERHLVVVLRSMNLTVLQTEDIFSAENKFDLLKPAFQLRPQLDADLTRFAASGALQENMTQWFLMQHKKIEKEVSLTINQISSIGLLSKVQSKLSLANQKDGDCYQSKTWQTISDSVSRTKSNFPIDSPFTILFAEAFRKRTRDLVQSSFVEALEAIKKQIRDVVGESLAENSGLVARIGCVKFYDYFQMIHRKAAALDASDLQAVLIEEFLRTLLKLVMFFENEYPLLANTQHIKSEESSTNNDATKYLCVSNILSSILAGFPEHSAKLFPNMSTASPTKRTGFARVRASFEEHAHEGRVTRAALNQALQEHNDKQNTPNCFIDEELSQLKTFGVHSFYLVLQLKQRGSYPQIFVDVIQELSYEYCEMWARSLLHKKIEPLRERLRMEQYDSSNQDWIKSHEGWIEQTITEDPLESDLDDSASETEAFGEEKVWLPWCETTTVSSFLFLCCYMLDEANRLVRNSDGAEEKHVELMQRTIRDVLVEQLTIISVEAYSEGVSLLLQAKTEQKQTPLNFGECCILQFLFDMYFVRATLGFSDFIRFGWGDELNEEECSPGLLRLKKLFEKMQDFIDPVDWEIYGPQLIENVVLQFRKSRLLFSSLSESNDINEINGKQVIISAQDTRPLVRIAEPVARFSLLPVPSNRRLHRPPSPSPGGVETGGSSTKRGAAAAPKNSNLFEERAPESSSASLKLQNILSGSTGSNILSAAASGTNLLSSAAKGMSYLSSATSSYLREGESRPKYF
uniref:Conserved oligomeric Golgi complex subunit 1 n=1 Tax=Globisporangium ultimum (strain ATCC 200006 / CBS 805.95 / DAOM BR144) TaxID=431595 RepID=K3WK72_GLOUD